MAERYSAENIRSKRQLRNRCAWIARDPYAAPNARRSRAVFRCIGSGQSAPPPSCYHHAVTSANAATGRPIPARVLPGNEKLRCPEGGEQPVFHDESWGNFWPDWTKWRRQEHGL